ncbi:MAG: hypothetical protein SGJ05_03935 [bacterium]|nr:hypothetical protein [bacterium]
MKKNVILPFILVLVVASSMYSQSVRHLTDCGRGASFVSNAILRSDGTVMVVGDLGRVGTYVAGASRIAWQCLPIQKFLYDVWSRNDTTIVVGEAGAVWFSIGYEGWMPSSLPKKETVRCVIVHNDTVYVGTEEGSVWECGNIRNGEWVRSYVAKASIIEMCSSDGRLAVVGKLGGLYERRSEWVDLSKENSTLEFASIIALGNIYVIGSDSGQVYRYSTTSGIWSAYQLMLPSDNFTMNDFRGRADKTLSISQGLDGELLATGNYYPGFSSGVGVHRSIDSGITWQHRPFPDDVVTDIVSLMYCPLVGIVNGRTFLVSATAGYPISIYESDQSMTSWNSRLRSQDIFRNLDTIVNGVQGQCSTVVRGASTVAASNTFICLQNDVATTSAFSSLVEKISRIVEIHLETDTITFDTIALLNGQYTSMHRIGGVVYMGGDSGRIASSSDDGVTWSVEVIDDIDFDNFIVTEVFLRGADLFAAAFNDNDGDRAWRIHGIVERSNGRWRHSSVQPPANTRVTVADIATNLDGQAAVLASNLDESNNWKYAIYQYDTQTASFNVLSLLPLESTTTPQIFYSNNTIGVLIPSRLFNVYMRCLYSNADWHCDTVKIKVDSSFLPLNSIATILVEDIGDKLVGKGFFRMISVDDGLHWLPLPNATTLFRGSTLFATVDQLRVLVGGFNDYFSIITLDSTSTSINYGSTQALNSICNPIHFMSNTRLVNYRVYDLLGRLISTTETTSYLDAIDQPAIETGHVYVLQMTTGIESCSMLFTR